jgi:DNA-binding MarR family transcriptional regulator
MEKEKKENQIVNNLRRVDQLYRNAMEAKLHHLDIHWSQHMVLMRIASQTEAYSQSELARQMHISSPAMAVSMRKLEETGYIARQVDKVDRRYNEVTVTEKGAQLVEESRRVFKEIEEQMFRGFSEEEKDQLDSLIERVQDNLL